MKAAHALTLLLVTINISFGFAQPGQHQDLLDKLHVPLGFKLSVYADKLPYARSMALGDDGVVYVGASDGKLYAVEDRNQDGLGNKNNVIATDLNTANGVAYKDGALYVAEINRIIRFDDITNLLSKPPKPAVVYDKLPSDKHHGWKYLRFGPDGKLYSAIGAPCNICKPERPYASIFRLNQDGSQFEVLASGIRNTVGFDWQPETNALFFNDNGRDWLGDDRPPEELNQWSGKLGEHFGYPHCHGKDIPDPQYSANTICKDYSAPVWQYKAHNAPLGMRFYRGNQFPARYKNDLFVALHGSWNRSEPDGYRVVLVRFKDGKPVSEESFIDGFLTKTGRVLGRPVDILELNDGSLLVSDDQQGLLYRVAYVGE